MFDRSYLSKLDSEFKQRWESRADEIFDETWQSEWRDRSYRSDPKRGRTQAGDTAAVVIEQLGESEWLLLVRVDGKAQTATLTGDEPADDVADQIEAMLWRDEPVEGGE